MTNLELLLESQNTHIFREPEFTKEEAKEFLKSKGMFLAEIDLSGITTKEEIFDRFAVALNFPSYFGRNWDALNDCLTDLTWLDEDKNEGYLIWINNLQQLEQISEGHILLDLLMNAAQFWSSQQKPLHLIFQ